MNLEQELKDALKRQPPPPGMVERVIATLKVEKPPAAAPSFWRLYRTGIELTAAAALFLVVGIGVVRDREASRERQQGEQAARQLITGLRIASEALNQARDEIKN